MDTSCLTPSKHSPISAMPAGMREISKEEFWRLVMAEKRNIHPYSERYHTHWDVVDTRQPWGWVSAGYASDHHRGEEKRYAVASHVGRT